MFGNEIELLFAKYLKGEITPVEMGRLQQLSGACSDRQLEQLFAKQWDVYHPTGEIDRKELRKISSQLSQKIEGKQRRNRWRTFILTAASVLLLCTTGLSAYLLLDKRTMSMLGEREVLVRVDRGQRVGVTLPDGSTVHLNSESELCYRQDYGKQERRVKLSGEGFFQVIKNNQKKFVVNSQFMDVEVLGTSFNFYAYESKDEVELTLVDGSVFLSTTTSPVQSALLQPNSKAVYDKKTGKLNVQSTNAAFETAWRIHELVFRSETLDRIFQKIERRYGICFSLQNNRFLEDRYTGVFDKEELPDVMKILSTHFNFKYKIKSDTVAIY